MDSGGDCVCLNDIYVGTRARTYMHKHITHTHTRTHRYTHAHTHISTCTKTDTHIRTDKCTHAKKENEKEERRITGLEQEGLEGKKKTQRRTRMS